MRDFSKMTRVIPKTLEQKFLFRCFRKSVLERFQYVNVVFIKQLGKSMLLKLSIKVEEILARKSRYTY